MLPLVVVVGLLLAVGIISLYCRKQREGFDLTEEERTSFVVFFSEKNYEGKRVKVKQPSDLDSLRTRPKFVVKSFYIQPGTTLYVTHKCGGDTVQTQHTEVPFTASVPDFRLCGWEGISVGPDTSFRYEVKPTLVTQHSGSACILDRTFGRVSENQIYVDDGCRGDFIYKNIPVSCSSEDYDYRSCTVPGLTTS